MWVVTTADFGYRKVDTDMKVLIFKNEAFANYGIFASLTENGLLLSMS